jgi:hypothetical protein
MVERAIGGLFIGGYGMTEPKDQSGTETLDRPLASPECGDQEYLIKRLLVLHQLSLTLQTQLNEESLLRIMLSGITAGEALGFNRALVFLLNEDKSELVGKLGVGPINAEECEHVWRSIADRGLTLSSFLEKFDQLKRYQTAELNVQTQAIRWKVGEEEDVFTQTLRDRTCYVVNPENVKLVPRPVAELLDAPEMVTAPLVVTGNFLGLVVADNKFSGRPITEEDIQLLSIVANQTAAALSHIRLIQELERFHAFLEDRIREALAEKERAQGEMIRHAKLATVGEMAVTIAHEIRNPLTSVRGFAQRLFKKQGDPETVQAYSEIIVQEVDRLNHVLGDVLDFARNVDTRFAPVDINEIVQKAVVLLSERLGKSNILCETTLDPKMPICHYDGPQLSQVLINLMKNGAEAMKEGGVLEVRTLAEEGACVVRVSDTGSGIPPGQLERIFEPFYSTKTKGTGLGLAFARRVIEEHGGRIEVESEIDRGTTFRVTLPLRLEAPKIDAVIESMGQAQPLVDRQDPLLAPAKRGRRRRAKGVDDGQDSGSR